jgi:hypothetical protein
MFVYCHCEEYVHCVQYKHSDVAILFFVIPDLIGNPFLNHVYVRFNGVASPPSVL